MTKVTTNIEVRFEDEHGAFGNRFAVDAEVLLTALEASPAADVAHIVRAAIASTVAAAA